MATNQTQAGLDEDVPALTPDLHADVHVEAKRQNRTFNGQIVLTLCAPSSPRAGP